MLAVHNVEDLHIYGHDDAIRFANVTFVHFSNSGDSDHVFLCFWFGFAE